MLARLLTTLPALTIAGALAIGCGGPPYDPEATASEALDSNEIAGAESGVLIGATAFDASPASPEDAAGRLVKLLPFAFPGGCATATRTFPNVVAIHFEHCLGKRGTLHGDVTVVYSKLAGGALNVDVGAKGLVSNEVVHVDLAASASFSIAPGSVTLEVRTRSAGTGSRGHVVTRSGHYKVVADTETPILQKPCVDVEGDWFTHVGLRTWTTSLTDLHVCGRQCPRAGGKLEYTGGISGVTFTIDFDGTARATWSDTRGHSGVIPLRCEAAAG